PLKARWVQLREVAYDDAGNPVHPEDPDLPLERVIEKMSKSKGNVINPDDVIAEHGADSMRLYEMFIGPLEKAAPWSTEGIQGIYRFLQRAWRLFHEEMEAQEDAAGERFRAPVEGAGSDAQQRLTARTIAGVTDDLEAMRFNTAISKLMIFAREIKKDAPLPRASAEAFILLLSPMAPHFAEEIWSLLGHTESLAYEPWPVADEKLLSEDRVTWVLQVNGKKRGEIELPADVSREDAEAAALAHENVQKVLAGRAPKKVIVVPGRLVNVVG
ncbi:MAG: class I tRNA ligase family protein, partial [bacterium]